MSVFETIIYEIQDNVGYITLNRPKALNVYNIQMRDELFQVLGAVKDDSEVKVGVLRGAGERAFCAGADLTEFLTAPSPTIARQVRWQRDVWGLFLSINKPMLAALHGYVFGSGIEMALCCDIRVVSDDVQLGVPETGLGIIPAAGGTQTLPRIIGRGYALELLLSGRWVKAEEALRMKLVNRVVSREDLWSEVDQLARKIKVHDANVLSYTKQAVTRGLDLRLEQGLELESRLGASLLEEMMQEEAT
ncbi:MAG TPA: enoyl-CoA hydratase/isomerase family protein [Dehalococcoidia bacterium]|nr:enoyl-CoA hydratase/isomerase family protein [Dehalococcoidia bacterium]